jgi:hypothetical protein
VIKLGDYIQILDESEIAMPQNCRKSIGTGGPNGFEKCPIF